MRDFFRSVLDRANDAEANSKGDRQAFDPEDRPGPAPPPELTTMAVRGEELACFPPDFGNRDGRPPDKYDEEWIHAGPNAVRDLQEVR